jgi:tripartite-type tricarboxylate transporter receptor subunit TctC
MATAGTPRDITGRIASELKAIYQLPDVHPTMVRNGEEVGGQTPEEFSRLLTTVPDWAKGLPLAAPGGLVNYYRKD